MTLDPVFTTYGESVMLVYRSPGGVNSEGVDFLPASESSVVATAVVEPRVPQDLQVEIDGDRWDAYQTFYVKGSIDRLRGNLESIRVGHRVYKVSRLQDYGDHGYFSCVGERQGQ